MEDYSTGKNIGARTRTAAGWKFLSKGTNTILQMGTAIVLARLLMPADFGIIAMATMVTGLAEVFRDLGLGQALVQRQKIEEMHLRSSFWGTLVMAALLYSSIVLSAPFVGEYFHELRMIPVLKVIALTIAFTPFAVVPRSLLQRNLDFKTPFFAELASSIAFGGVGIVMALLGYGYWALVAASVVKAFANTVALCILTRYVPPIIPSFRGIGDLYSFGIGVTGVGIGHYIATKIDYFAIGRRLNADALGLYTRAYSFVTYPATFAATVGPVFFPAFSRMQSDHKRMRNAYGRVTTLMAAVFFPFLAIAIISAPELIPIVFGEQWAPSVIPAQVLIILGICKITASAADAVIKAAGRVYGEAWRQMLYGVLVGVGAWFAAPHGLIAVAVAVACANIIHYTLIGQLVWSAIGFGLTDYARAFRGPVLATVATLIIGGIFRMAALAAGHNTIMVLIITVIPATLAAGLMTLRSPFSEMKAAVHEIAHFGRRGLALVR